MTGLKKYDMINLYIKILAIQEKEKKENIEGYCMNCEMIYRIRRSI